MYQMYPEWGPARHRHQDPEPMAAPSRRPRYWERDLVTAGTRDGDADRPDDN